MNDGGAGTTASALVPIRKRSLRARVRDAAADLSLKYPRARAVVEKGAIPAAGFAGVWGVIYGSRIPVFEWEFAVFLVATTYTVLGQLLPVVSKEPMMAVHSVRELLRELRVAIMLRPVEENWREWSIADWLERVSKVTAMVERQAAAVLVATGAIDQGDRVSANLMVRVKAVQKDDEVKKRVRLLSRALASPNTDRPEEFELTFPYDAEDEGVIDGAANYLDSYLVMISRGENAANDGYPWIALRVPTKEKYALPGGPDVTHLEKKRKDKQHEPFASYVPFPADAAKTRFRGKVGDDSRGAFARYFARDEIGVHSFICYGLSWGGAPIGALNVNGPHGDFLQKKTARTVIDAVMSPHLEIAASLAFIFSENFVRWSNEEETRQAAPAAQSVS